MTEKSIHVVFQVLNFLKSSESKRYKLLPIDKLILIYLASHKGVRGIFPAQKTIAEEIEYNIRNTRRRLHYLESIGLLFVEKINRKNHYHLTFLYQQDIQEEISSLNKGAETPNKLSTIEGLHAPYEHEKLSTGDKIGGLQTPSQRVYRPPHRGSTGAPNNKVSNKRRKESGAKRTRPHPLPSFFRPNKQSIELAESLGLEPSLLDAFKDFCASRGEVSCDWDARFRKYCRDEIALGRTNHLSTETVNCSAPEPNDLYPEPSTERYERRTDDIAVKALGNILGKLGIRKPYHEKGLEGVRRAAEEGNC